MFPDISCKHYKWEPEGTLAGERSYRLEARKMFNTKKVLGQAELLRSQKDGKAT